jgi:hypothetical protein
LQATTIESNFVAGHKLGNAIALSAIQPNANNTLKRCSINIVCREVLQSKGKGIFYTVDIIFSRFEQKIDEVGKGKGVQNCR